VLGFFWQWAGEIHAIPGTLDMDTRPQDAGSNPRLALRAVGAGMFGGIAYWLVAGRLAGNWRDAARPDPISPAP
jgi:hypothetical protein